MSAIIKVRRWNYTGSMPSSLSSLILQDGEPLLVNHSELYFGDGVHAISYLTPLYLMKPLYMHRLVKYNNSNIQYAMGWACFINEKPSMTYPEIASWLYDSGHVSAASAYDFAGGVGNTSDVRKGDNSGSTYIGNGVSGCFSKDGSIIYYKINYNGSITVSQNTCRIISSRIS